MASRDNQTMQIIVIVLALAFILMSVGLVMVNNARKTAVARAIDENGKADSARSDLRVLQAEANSYKTWIGFGEGDNYADLQEAFAKDMQRWGSTFEEAGQAYRTILENIFEENSKLGQREGDAKAQVIDFKKKLLAIQEQTNEQIKKFEDDTKKALADKESLRNEFNKSREQINAENAKIAGQLEDQRKQIDTLVAEHDVAQKVLQKKITGLQRVIEILKSKQTPTDPFAQPADGRIAWVNQREGKVWINLGERDHLSPQVTFSVYSGDSHDVNAAISKGSIEVVRILSAHMAEARISSDKSTRPLMEGDKIYSQVWNRGRQMGFAITGVIDINDDGTSDIEQLKRIIQLNNGKVDAVPNGKGDIEGEMTVDTRYLILGKPGGIVGDSSGNARKSYQTMSAEADTLNIEVITLEEFLNLMGWHAENRAVKLGKGARSDDFPPRPLTDYKPQGPNSRKAFFRQRKPQPSY